MGNDDLRKIFRDTKHGVKGYIKAQLTLMIITFLIFSIGLVIIDVQFPLLIAFVIAILDIVPVIGSGVVMLPWVMVSLIQGNAQRALALALVYVIGTLIRQLIEPKITGDKIGIRPLFTFIATILGSLIFGPVGIIVGPILAVIIKSIIDIRKDKKGIN